MNVDDGCKDDKDCKEDEVCQKGECIETTYLSEGDACDSSDHTKVCQEPLVCRNGECQNEQKDDASCKSDEDCAESEYKTCLPSGSCGTIHPIGELCDNEQNLCEEGLTCVTAVCSQVVTEGQACFEDDSIICESELLCIEGACRKFEMNLEKGSECNSSYKICKEEFVCRDAVCISEKAEDDSCDDEALDLCASGLACLKGKCTPYGDTCEKTSDCQEKDSFCCQNEECGLKGYCIPYDDTTTYDKLCLYKTKPGIFEAQIQCRWQPPEDAYPTSKMVEMPPIVGHFANKAGIDNVIAIFSYAVRASEPTADQLISAVRFINPETCETLETVRYNLARHAINMPASADLDGDGYMEFITFAEGQIPVAFKWDEKKQAHTEMWKSTLAAKNYYAMVFDVDGNGSPEVIVGNSVIDGKTGKTIFEGSSMGGYNGAIGNFDNNAEGLATLVIKNLVLQWNKDANWTTIAKLPTSYTYSAYADFGTPGEKPEDFNYTKLDGFPEIVAGSGGKLALYGLISKGDGTYDVQTLMNVNYTVASDGTAAKGGPITIGDFDSDGLPEIGVASSGYFGVYDPRCTQYKEDEKTKEILCADKNVLWERWSQDASSGQTGSSLFDFDGDGQTEAVYADECFTRIYDGKSGKVLFSSKRSSGTSYEAPVVADVDGDGSAEILMGSDQNIACYDDSSSKINPSKPGTSNCVDPIHEGIPCIDDEDCPMAKNCDKTLKLCLCESDDDCNTQMAPGKNTILKQYVCAPPIHPQVGFMTNPKGEAARTMLQQRGTRPDGWKDGDYKVCRATRMTMDIGVSDLMIFKDRLDRWVSSRSLWNQHAYNIINIEDDGKVPTVTSWIQNWLLKNTGLTIDGTNDPRPVYNNYRLNKQGQYGAGTVPDITGRFIPGSICGTAKGDEETEHYLISGKLCNRGTKPVAQNLPATFFYYDENATDHRGDVICTSYTKTIVGVDECSQVGCEITKDELDALNGKKVLMVSNLDENGQPSTVECNSDNNTDVTIVEGCEEEIEVVY